MTTLFDNQTEDGVSASHTIAEDITTIVATGGNWERVRLVLQLETAVGSGVYVDVPEWEMRGPGSKNVVTNGAAGRKLKVRLLGADLTDTIPGITVDAN